MKNFASFLAFVFGGILLGVGARIAVESLELPEVHVSHSTGACVRVIESDGSRKACPKVLPEKYHHVWVQ